MNKTKHILKNLAELSMFLEINPGPVLQLTEDGKVAIANSAAITLFQQQNISGCLWFDLCPGMNLDTWKSICNSKDSLFLETEVGDASLLFSYVCTNTKDVFAFGTDITFLKKNFEKKLADKSSVITEMARFPDMNPGPVLRMNFDSTILLSNKAAASVFGEALLNKRWKNICPGLTDGIWQDILSSDSIIPVEAQVGSRHFVFNHRRDVLTNLVFTYGTDITIIKDIEKKLQEQKAKVAEVARFPDMNPGPVLRMNLHAEIRLCNAAAQKVFGDDVTGRSWLDVCPGMNQNVWEQITIAERVFPFETCIGDQYFVFNHRTDFVTNLVFTYGTNITYQKLTEKQLIQSEKMASLGELTAGIAHEIQNPLNFVNNFSEVNLELLDEMQQEIKDGNNNDALKVTEDIDIILKKFLFTARGQMEL